MNYTVLHVGDPKEAYFREAFAEYQKRLSPYGGLDDVLIRPAKSAGDELSPQEIRKVLAEEETQILKTLAAPALAKSFKIALCVEGEERSSEALADLILKVQNQGKNRITFLIGSSWGLSENVKKACDLRLSFSPMTFAHSLFRVMLVEQIYRAEGILRGTKYHK